MWCSGFLYLQTQRRRTNISCAHRDAQHDSTQVQHTNHTFKIASLIRLYMPSQHTEKKLKKSENNA